MPADYIFGYGSLVNEATLSEGDISFNARLEGFFRSWSHKVETPFGRVTALGLVEQPWGVISGAIVPACEATLSKIDDREIGYIRIDVSSKVRAEIEIDGRVFVYLSSEKRPADGNSYPIPRSYVDTVMLGYLRRYGFDGLCAFMMTTLGWQSEILEDRACPTYPRSVALPPGVATMFSELVMERRCERY